VAALGPDAPFSQDRQRVEASTLALFGSAGPLVSLNHYNLVRVPQVLHHSSEASVLVIEDLGPLITLWDLLGPKSLHNIDVSDEEAETIGRNIGDRLGAFFAALHTSRIAGGASQVAEQSLNYLVVLDATVKPVLERLKVHEDAAQLYSRVLKDYTRDPLPEEKCVTLGDCHPGAVLLPGWAELVGHSDHHPTLAAIDWEFSTTCGRGVNGDMAQFLASTHCHWLYLRALGKAGDSGLPVVPALRATEGLMHGICTRYAHVSRLDTKLHPAATRQLLRSAFILHGREMINQSTWRDWELGSSAITKDELDVDMVSVGADYLRLAGDSVEDMLGQSTRLDNERMIKRLFGW
jgi:hypothetical protein